MMSLAVCRPLCWEGVEAVGEYLEEGLKKGRGVPRMVGLLPRGGPHPLRRNLDSRDETNPSPESHYCAPGTTAAGLASLVHALTVTFTDRP